MSSRSRILGVMALTLAMLLVAGPALAHVTVRVDDPAPAAFAKYTVRVPNERDETATVRVEVQLPDEFEGARYQPLAGWDISVDEGVMVIDGGRIEPGEFQEFHFSARNPEEAGDVVFPSIQVYDDGEEVGWVGEPDSDQPAPVVTIAEETAVEEDPADDEPVAEETEPVAEETEPVAAPEQPTDAANEQAAGEVEPTPTSATNSTLSVIALVAAAIALILGGAAFARTRKPGDS